jgi:hypothetical protein
MAGVLLPVGAREASFPVGTGRGGHCSVVKRPGRVADHSPPSGAEVKNCGAILPLPIGLHGVVHN